MTQFVIEGQAHAALQALDAQVDRVLSEVEDGLHGMARDPRNNVTDDSESPPTKKRRLGEREAESGDRVKQGSVWGSAAATHGIAAEADGKRMAFGKVIVQYDEAPDVKANCPACFAPGKGRDKWCTSPAACWAAGKEWAHTRLDAFPDEACKGSDAGNVQDLDWTTFSTVVAEPRREGSRGKGGGKSGGKGGGNGGAKGGGKGRGGKGKGGTKGGRSNQRFGRQ